MQSEQTLKIETISLQTCLSEDRLFRARISSSRELKWNGTPKYNQSNLQHSLLKMAKLESFYT